MWGIIGVMVFIVLLVAFWELWITLAMLALGAGIVLVGICIAIFAILYIVR